MALGSLSVGGKPGALGVFRGPKGPGESGVGFAKCPGKPSGSPSERAFLAFVSSWALTDSNRPPLPRKGSPGGLGVSQLAGKMACFRR